MARKRVVSWEFTDDRTGEVLSEEQATLVNISIGGRSWELMLGEKSLGDLEKFLTPYLRGVEPKVRRTRQVNNAEVRAWALEQGLTVGEKGRIPERIIRDFLAAQGLPYD